ncbi:L-aspartate oxidase [Exiguobacterium sp. RIT341]|uniref:L-aspartate oxidase n=1 Tax=Exiguobacterium sp. RIT341 TaxID=1470592 RepID=UPI00044935A4|nr:FAD-binding protein [Exiguobacterium sp. RIT341]EZP60604.1 L-aspartate oxidase [Exiguobacterium sp. RIT341]
MSLHKRLETDVLIIGTGLAAISVALHLPPGTEALLVTKGTRFETNSVRAQGGIASAYAEVDHRGHFEDTCQAAKGRINLSAVDYVTRSGAEAMEFLLRQGVLFDQSEGEFLLGREGAHRLPRIYHSGGDETGKRIMETLMPRVPFPILEQTCITELIQVNGQVVGAVGYSHGEPIEIVARATILATGGVGGIFASSTNDPSIQGNGIALAFEAGATIRDLGYIQHHPTVLVHAGRSEGLITEALRGAGATLVTKSGDRIMADHPMQDLAARDEVAKRIHEVRKHEPVYLDTSKVVDRTKRFPTFVEKCEKLNINPDLVEIAPGIHFLMGGIETDLTGQTNVEGLYAVGETASIGLHGRNRLASNSLLECVVMGKAVAEQLELLPGPSVKQVKQRPGTLRSVTDHLSQVIGVEMDVRQVQECLDALKGWTLEESGQEAEENRLRYVTACLLLEGARSRLTGEDENIEQVAVTATTGGIFNRGHRTVGYHE